MSWNLSNAGGWPASSHHGVGQAEQYYVNSNPKYAASSYDNIQQYAAQAHQHFQRYSAAPYPGLGALKPGYDQCSTAPGYVGTGVYTGTAGSRCEASDARDFSACKMPGFPTGALPDSMQSLHVQNFGGSMEEMHYAAAAAAAKGSTGIFPWMKAPYASESSILSYFIASPAAVMLTTG